MTGTDGHRQKSANRPGQLRGFTLLELLAGIAVFALLSILVLSGIRLGMRSWEAAADRSAENEQIRIVHRLLRRQLTASLALAASNTGRWRLQFEGDPTSLRFVTEFPAYVAGGGAQMVTLTAENQGRNRRLMLRWWPLHAARDASPQDDAVLLPDLSDIAFAYFGAGDQNALPRWHDRWSEMRVLPQLVRIRITGASGRPWPSLVVPLKVDAVRFYLSPAERPESDEGVSTNLEQTAGRGAGSGQRS